MEKKELGELKRIDNLREVWENEQYDFSPWLTEDENIKLLGEAVGIPDIIVQEREKAVGPFSVDIYATDESGEKAIVIENQLEETNHDHLGKCLTYASGVNASAIIWIVKKARDDHRKAMEWLNDHTDEDIGFFLLEIELWQIDDSRIAPSFNVIVKPNGWAKRIKEQTQWNDTDQKRYQFWTSFRDCARQNEKFKNVFTTIDSKTPNKYRFDLYVGKTGYFIRLSVNLSSNSIGCGLYIPVDAPFEQFENDKEKLQEKLNSEITVTHADTVNGVTIKKEIDCNNEDTWTECFDWMMEKAILFKEIFNEYGN